MNKSESIGKISAALLKAQSSMGDAVKGAANPFFRSSYADLNSIREAVTPALNANGITVLQPTTTLDGRYYVETLLLHESGEYLSSLTEIVAAKANDPQATGSAISYARRYGLQSFLSVGAVDDDSEAAMGRGKSSGPSPAQASYAAKQAVKASTSPVVESKVATEAVGVTGDLDAKGTSAPVTAPTERKRTPFRKPEAKTTAPAATSNGSGGGGW
jgi:hypothetical protein